MTVILWLKYGMHTGDAPRLKLVEYARAAVEPSAAVMKVFFEITKRMQREGKLTEDEAADLRFSAYARAEITEYCKGEVSDLDDTTVLRVRDRLIARYTAEATKEIEAERSKAAMARKEESLALRRADLASDQLNAMSGSVQKEITDIYKKAEDDATDIATITSATVKWGLTILVALAIVISAGAVALTVAPTMGKIWRLRLQVV